MTSWRGERAERQAVEEIHLQRPPPGARWSGVLLSGTCFGVGTQLDTAVERAITHVTRQDRCRPALRAQQTLSVTTNELHLGLHGSAKRLHLQTSCSKLLPTVYCSSSSRNEKRRLSNSYYATTTMLTSCTCTHSSRRRSTRAHIAGRQRHAPLQLGGRVLGRSIILFP